MNPPRTNQRVSLHIPISCTHAQSGAPALDFKLVEAGVVPPTSRAPTGVIPGSGKGRPGTVENQCNEFVDRAHTQHPYLTRAQIESTLISMRRRAIQSNMPFTAPTNEEKDQELVSSEPAQTAEEAHDTTIISDDSPKYTHGDALQTPSEEEHST